MKTLPFRTLCLSKTLPISLVNIQELWENCEYETRNFEVFGNNFTES